MLHVVLACLTPVFWGMGGDTLGMPPSNFCTAPQDDTGRSKPPRGAVSSSGHAQMSEALGTSKTEKPPLQRCLTVAETKVPGRAATPNSSHLVPDVCVPPSQSI